MSDLKNRVYKVLTKEGYRFIESDDILHIQGHSSFHNLLCFIWLILKTILLTGTFMIILASCSEESFNVPDTGRKIVINSLISTNKFFSVRISMSAHVTDYSDSALIESINYINNATVKVYQNGMLKDSLYNIKKEIGNSGDCYDHDNYYSKHLIPLPGEEYEIKVTAPGLPVATASTFIPECVNIDKVDTTHFYSNFNIPDWPLFQNIIFHINFTDPATEKNYYLLKVYSKDQPWGFPIVATFYCKDPVVEEKLSNPSSVSLEGIAFTDKIFDGRNYTLNTSVPGTCIKDSECAEYDRVIYLHLYSITKEYYRYIQALNLYKELNHSSFYDPVLIPSNISGGLGFFSGAALATDSIIISRYQP